MNSVNLVTAKVNHISKTILFNDDNGTMIKKDTALHHSNSKSGEDSTDNSSTDSDTNEFSGYSVKELKQMLIDLDKEYETQAEAIKAKYKGLKDAAKTLIHIATNENKNDKNDKSDRKEITGSKGSKNRKNY